MICLDASAASTLDWSVERKEGLKWIASGKKILWHLDLGLFDRLKMPLSHPSQFMTLCLAVDHFRDTIWKEFHPFSLGVCLYQGTSDLILQWDDALEKAYKLQSDKGDLAFRLFCLNAGAEYLKALTERIPDKIPVYLKFTLLPEDPLEKALFTNPERFGRILIDASYSWRAEEELKTAICMPPLDVISHLDPFRKAILAHPFAKLIPEERLTYSWEGLDLLIYSEKCVSNQGKRKIQGFIAAGGEVKEV